VRDRVDWRDSVNNWHGLVNNWRDSVNNWRDSVNNWHDSVNNWRDSVNNWHDLVNNLVSTPRLRARQHDMTRLRMHAKQLAAQTLSTLQTKCTTQHNPTQHIMHTF
jgi:prophage DNA circulation protein